MGCKYKVNIKNIQYNYKVILSELQGKYKFKLFCTGGKYDDTEIKEEIASLEEENEYLNSIVDQLPKVKVEGEYPTLDNTLQAKMKVDLKGNTQQNGTPTPDTPIPVQVVSGDNTIKVEGKNLLNDTLEAIQPINVGGTWTNNKYVYGGVTFTLNDDGSITANGTASSTAQIGIDFIPDLTKTYILNGISGGSASTYIMKGVYYDSNNAYISEQSFYSGDKQLNIPNNTAKIRVFCTIVSGATVNNVEYFPMLRLSTESDTYQPYQSTTYPINLPNGMEMCWIPDTDYQDEMFKNEEGHPLYNSSLVNGGWYKYGEIGKVVFNGSENDWSLDLTGTNTYRFRIDENTLANAQSGFCNNNQWVTSGFSGDNQLIGKLNNKLYYRINKSIVDVQTGNTTVNQFKTWLSNNNIICCSLLATPTYTKITDTTLISQLEALKEAESYLGQTNISQVNNDAPFIINASALYDLNNLITRVAILETE